MEDNWIGKEIKHSILKIRVNGKNQGTSNSDLPMTKTFSSVQIFYRRRERKENDNLKKRGRGQPGPGKWLLQSSSWTMCHRH